MCASRVIAKNKQRELALLPVADLPETAPASLRFVPVLIARQ